MERKTGAQGGQQAIGQWLERMIDALSAHIAILDNEGTIIAANDAWHRFAREYHLNMPHAGVGANYLDVCDAVRGEDAVTAQRAAQAIREGIEKHGSIFSMEYLLCEHEGQQIWFQMQVTRFVLLDAVYLVVAHENISERKRAELRLQESEKRFRLLIEKSSDMLMVLDKEYMIRYVSPSAEVLLGYTPQERLGHYGFEFAHSSDLARVQEQLQEFILQPGAGLHLQLRARHRNGSWHWIETIGTNYLHDRDIQGLVMCYRDITEHVQTQECLRVGKEQLEAILHGVADGIVVQDKTGGVQYANTAAALALVDSCCVDALLRNPLETIVGQFDMVDEMGNALSYWDLPGGRVLAGAASANATICITKRPTGKTLWAIIQARPVFDDKGTLQFAINIIHDITERKLMEQRKDEFIAMASHELKTPLTSLKIFMGILQRHFSKNGEGQYLEQLTRIDTQVNTLTELINDMLDVSRIQVGKLVMRAEPFNLSNLVIDTVKAVQGTLNTHTFRIEAEENVHVCGDPDRIGQVLLNLLSNAVKYSPRDSPSQNPRQTKLVIVRLVCDQKEATMSVQDFGIGIDKAHQERIFERFYQVTDPMEKTFPGLGIGLYISHEIIERHHGHMWVESEKSIGSTFNFTIPLE